MLNAGALGEAMNFEHVQYKYIWQQTNLMLETVNAFMSNYMYTASYHPELVEHMKEIIDLAPGRVRCLSEIPRGKGPIVCCASGSSFNKVAPTLKDWKGAVMCSTSQASTLVKYGRTPDYVVCMDPRQAPADELAAPDWGDAAMIGHVSIPTKYMEQWLKRARGKIYLGRIMEPNYDWYSHHLAKGYPDIRHIIIPMIDSLSAEVGFATWLGYGPVYLLGADYSGPRFDRWDYHYETGEWTLDADSSGYDAAKVTVQGHLAMQYSTRGAIIAAMLQILNPRYRQRVYQLSDTTILDEFPKAEWDDILAGADPPEYDVEAVREIAEVKLAASQTFLVSTNAGFGPDYQIYITPDELRMVMTMIGYNRQVVRNKQYFAQSEAFHKKPLRELIKEGLATVVMGDLLMHGSEEFGEWDWRKMEPIDLGPGLNVLNEKIAVEHDVITPEGKQEKRMLPLSDTDTVRIVQQTLKDIDAMPPEAQEKALGPVLSRYRHLVREAKRLKEPTAMVEGDPSILGRFLKPEEEGVREVHDESGDVTG